MRRKLKTGLEVALVTVAVALSAGNAGAQTPVTPPAPAAAGCMLGPVQCGFINLVEHGLGQVRGHWWDAKRKWYDEHWSGGGRYPLATAWQIVPVFESVTKAAIADPTRANRSAAAQFAIGVERYFNPDLRPSGGYASYPGNRGAADHTWFDDNGWLGLAFLDAYKATGNQRFVTDAQRAFNFISAAAWDASAGGLWWDTSHHFKASETFASGTLLAALLYAQTKSPAYLTRALQFIAWGDQHLLNADGLYARSDVSNISMGYVQTPLIEAHYVLCRAANRPDLCAQAQSLTVLALKRFGLNADMGPQYDAVYLSWALEIYSREGRDPRLYMLAYANAQRALANARDQNGLFVRAWDGGPLSAHQSQIGSVQAEGAALSLLASLALYPPPAG